jgi:SAM-dependent methyltransferase
MLISPEYQAMQRDMHARKVYGNSGGKWMYTVAGIAAVHGCSTILDYGCGTGAMVANLRKLGPAFAEDYRISEYDPGVARKDRHPKGGADLVCCIDTLEHIEPDCLADVLADLRSLTFQMLFTVISTRLAGKVLPDGRNAHLIVEPASWWHDKLECTGFVFKQQWEHTSFEWCAVWRRTS